MTEGYKAVQFGKEVEEFLTSSIGVYLINKADEDRKKAMSLFGRSDPTDSKIMSDIKEDFNTPNKVLMWLSIAVEEGHNKQLEKEANEETNQ